ncbi:hypothetical protein KIPB_002587 [Kipferlia bialata]|uniref:Uncharacterized protein n=1 Tax=Kipferlia bialata TaxID=797122 RepID=A0A391NJG8_9EUKA|nr:hypothetical protein KIPB_002587 [Kipferlia bialata]|eukprot:g2587.t1
MPHGQYLVSVPSSEYTRQDEKVYAYDTISGEWLDWGGVSKPWKYLSTWQCLSSVCGEALVPNTNNSCSSISIDPELVYPHPDLHWAYSPPSSVWHAEE